MLTRLRRSMADKDQGFTLIELLVVIIIIGILAAIAIPVFLNQRKKAVDASMKSDLKNAATLVETWMVDNPGVRFANPIVWMDGRGLPAAVPLVGLKVSPGSEIWVDASTNTLGAYCLYIWNPNSSVAPSKSGPLMTYLSLKGGLQSATQLGSCP